MFKQEKNIKFFLTLTLAFFVCNENLIFAVKDLDFNVNLDYNEDNLTQMALDQLQRIDFTLEKLGQAINSGQVRVKEKNNAKEYLIKTRAFIQDLNTRNFEYSELIPLNSYLIQNIDFVVSNNFLKIYYIDHSHLNIIFKRLDPAFAKQSLLLNEKNLDGIIDKLKNVGFNKFNLIIRNLEKKAKNNIISKKARPFINRTFPYLGLAAYLVFLNKDSFINKFPNIGQYLSNLGVLSKADELEKNQKESSSSGKVEYKESQNFSKLKDYFSIIAAIDKKPIFNLCIGTFMAPIIKKDFQDLYKWSGERFEDFINILKGESIKDRSLIKKPKLTFEKLFGYSSLKKELFNIINYFKNKELFDLVGQEIPSCYLISGRVADASEIVNALAGEINKVISSKNSSKFCGIYNISANQLVDKDFKVKDLISKIEDSEIEHCVIFLDNLDWLYLHAFEKPQAWLTLTELLKVVKSKKQISIFVSLKSLNLLDKSMSVFFDGFIKINNYDEADIKEILIKELENRSISLSKFDLDSLVQRVKGLKGLSLTQIKAALNKACLNAYSANRVLLQTDLENVFLETN